MARGSERTRTRRSIRSENPTGVHRSPRLRGQQLALRPREARRPQHAYGERADGVLSASPGDDVVPPDGLVGGPDRESLSARLLREGGMEGLSGHQGGAAPRREANFD